MRWLSEGGWTLDTLGQDSVRAHGDLILGTVVWTIEKPKINMILNERYYVYQGRCSFC